MSKQKIKEEIGKTFSLQLTDPNHPVFKPFDVVEHRKGGRYVILMVCKIEATGEPAYAYKGEDGQVWVRPIAEMDDGRFTKVI